MSHKKLILIFCLAFGIMGTQAFAAGFEKVTTWSGRYAGVAGAAVSSVEGSESLYFNPAGLSNGNAAIEASLNFSPTFGKYYGPIVASGTQAESSRKFSPVAGGLVSYKLTPQLGVGAGFFVSGGTKAIYEGVDFTARGFESLNPAFKSDLSVTEASIGAGYEIMPGLRIGGAWRIVHVGATLATAQAGTTPAVNLTSIEINDLSATKYNGFRVGVQYTAPERAWGLGVNWRNGIDFTADGTSSSRTELQSPAAAPVLNNTGGAASISATFPNQVALGGFYGIVKDVRLLGEFVWTQYSKNQALVLNGTVTTAGGPISLPSIPLGWHNQMNLKVGVECTAVQDWAFRAGYALTNPVTPTELARATFASPGYGHTLTLGTGTSILGKLMDVNGAVEYSFASGDGTTPTTSGPITGEYKTNAFVVHLGVNYRL